MIREHGSLKLKSSKPPATEFAAVSNPLWSFERYLKYLMKVIPLRLKNRLLATPRWNCYRLCMSYYVYMRPKTKPVKRNIRCRTNQLCSLQIPSPCLTQTHGAGVMWAEPHEQEKSRCIPSRMSFSTHILARLACKMLAQTTWRQRLVQCAKYKMKIFMFVPESRIYSSVGKKLSYQKRAFLKIPPLVRNSLCGFAFHHLTPIAYTVPPPCHDTILF